jgi:glutamine amidotransferase
MSVIVVDYGMGNLRSVSKALESLGASVRVSSKPADVAAAERVVLPGVGAFPAAMRELAARGLVEPIKAAIASARPYLGICLGLQLLFERSEEGDGGPGLGVLQGTVRRFAGQGLKVPHIGWNQVSARADCPLMWGVPHGSFVYFVHSYYGEPADRAVVAGETEYGGRFASLLWRDRLFATQFHPEKSQAIGLKLLKNFLALPA